MATKVQAKTYFPGSILDLNNGFCNGMWDPHHDERSSASEKNHYNSFMMIQAMDGYSGYAKEQMRQTILKQESIFRHQLEELHRVYKRQRDLMNEITRNSHSNFSMPLKDYGDLNSKWNTTQRRVIDLELPADVDEDNEDKQPLENVHKLADLNEPIQMEEASFPPTNSNSNSGIWNSSKIISQQSEHLSYNNGYGNGTLQGESNKPVDHSSRKRKIFGVDLCERSPIISSQNLEKKLPPWLIKSTLCNEQVKGKETTIYQMNLDSLQHHSQQFFKKSEMTKGITKILGVPIIDLPDKYKDSVNGTHDQKDETKGLFIKENGEENKLRHQIDLNLSFDEEEGPTSTPYIPEAVVKLASMEIDLEADPPSTRVDSPSNVIDGDDDLVKVAAEAIMSMSSSEPPPEVAAPAVADTLLRWFAEVIEKNSSEEGFVVPEGMDYFEYMTLKIQETNEKYERYNNKPIEEDEGLLKKRTTKRGQGKRGRQRKDFQRDVLPGIVSLSRREVTEDIQTFEEAFTGIGVSWQSKRKVAGKNGRGRRRSVASDSPPPAPPEEESGCREVVAIEEKGLSGWGKRTRRLPRQRCQNGGSHQSLALKC